MKNIFRFIKFRSAVNKVKDLVKLYHLNFLLDLVGKDFLSDEELKYLEKKLGKDRVNTKRVPILNQIFAFGKISEKVGLENANKLTKKDLDAWIKENNIDVNEELSKIKAQAYLDILSKQFQIEKDVRQEILNQFEKGNFKTSQFVDFIKSKFEDWSYLKGSISNVAESALNKGKAEEIKAKAKQEGKEDPLVYKVPIMDEKLCSSCRKAYLNSDGTPKLFKLSELEGNGTNIGLKPNDWKPTLGQLHIHCRCVLQYFEELPNTTLKDYEFNESKQRYILKEEILNDDKRKVQRKSKVKIDIGDKHFEV